MLSRKEVITMQEKPQKQVFTDKQLERIITSIESLKFGSVLITVQDGRVVLIEKNEKYKE